MFRLIYPAYTAIGAFAAAVTFLMNRTALVTATAITQHLLYILVCGLTLFLMALFCRNLDRRYWYGAAASLGLAFATVETSAVLVAAVLLTLVLAGFRLGWKSLGLLFAKGALVFAATVLLVWPKGILQLGALKGYGYLAYMALYRKTFTPISARQLWAFRLRVYPLEFVIPLLALVAALVWWRRLTYRREILPFLVYATMFAAVTMVITLPYTHYHGSLLISSAVLVGAMFGELWLRNNRVLTISLSVVLAATLAGMTTQYYRETAKAKSAHDYYSDLLNYLGKNGEVTSFYVPFVLVPTIHFYYPGLTIVGYDTDWLPKDLAAAWAKAGPGWGLLCAESTCHAVRGQMPPAVPLRQAQVAAGGIAAHGENSPGEEPLYSLTVEKPGPATGGMSAAGLSSGSGTERAP